MSSLCDAQDETQGLVHAEQVFYQWAASPAPVETILGIRMLCSTLSYGYILFTSILFMPNGNKDNQKNIKDIFELLTC